MIIMSEYFDEAGNKIDMELLAAFAEARSIWKPASIQDEPETRLTQWRVFKVKGLSNEDETIHFVGRANWEGRVCSPVQTYDPTNRRGVTRSGRVYELLGPSGHNSDAMYVWGRWCNMNQIEEVIDITEEYDV